MVQAEMSALPTPDSTGDFSSQYLLSVRFDDIPLDRAIAMLSKRDPSAPFVYIVTPNADHWIRLQRQPELLPLYSPAWLSLCDSRIIQLLAGWRGVKLEIAPGSDLTQRLFDDVVQRDTPVTIIGVTEEMVEKLRAQYGLTRLAHHNPPMGFIRKPEAVRECVDFILANPSRFILLCVGSPQQEKLAAAIIASGQAVGVGLCVGASVEFVVGAKKRAPTWMQRSHLEWLHRLASEPRRLWKRYILEAPALLRLMMKVPRGGG
jgi:N-acetylglucosaminyldiphosphoundecaprenol N-acetyl-beta-D-mannosaminyltransferase